ncbi:uncharacterized protein N7479_006397 [Penicillium vulpinum]|uniref:Uncharacterized protein n=1 Tax=Penicillium vulpinum TaxID=29845 RepID=A0A1V6S240_9EURO|nr:uncharacterized protein N7479_006397 [Penicillium vulpinum]KAJ5959247.1 hypothetical protein N7479_006397 [Penicillium vulpinum]OQE07928.1 hypothetical protein PENVUL_c011G06736 [Penicillium vulpinum]
MSTGLNIPQNGLSLHFGDQSGDLSVKPNQIMRLNLVQSTLDDLIQSLRKDQPARVRLGKHPSLHYGGKSQMFHAYPETHRSEIYHSSSDKETLYFTGVLSHSLEVEKAKNATAATDQALADLEEKLNAHERGKESKKTHIISHPDELRGLRGSKAGYKGLTTKIELEKDRLLKTAANRSLTASPILGTPKSPSLAMTPTSAPMMQSKDRARLEALKTPFIHLLAVRAVSAKFLARQTRTTVEDCTALGEKFGVVNRINPEKYNLRDKVYKDLDVFGFNYTEEDRKEAIENSISAFDRMRISRSDKLWQTLLPKAERGKGKCLSRLNLRTGPPQKPAAPLAKANGEDSGKDNETDRATKGSAPATKTTSTSQKARDKDPIKRPTKPKNTNSTLTGRITKKTGGKAPVKVDSKIKSAEFVHSSDEDDDNDMPEIPPAAPAPAPAPAPMPAPKQQPKEHERTPSASKPPAPKIKAPAKPRITETTSVPSAPPPKAKPETSKPKLEPSKPVTKATASKRPPSRPSNSPQKPSPLGSSPPSNVSDATSTSRNRSDSQNQSSGSSSSSPLISQLAKTTKVGRAAPVAGKTVKSAAQTNGITKATSATTNPLKRKAESDQLSVPQAGRPAGNLEAKRRRAVSSSSGGSTGSASPPMSYEILRQQLREKSQKFKNFYTKYRNLHDSLAALPNPPQVDLDKLQKQHIHLQRMKKEIWEEDRQLRDGLHS